MEFFREMALDVNEARVQGGLYNYKKEIPARDKSSGTTSQEVEGTNGSRFLLITKSRSQCGGKHKQKVIIKTKQWVCLSFLPPNEAPMPGGSTAIKSAHFLSPLIRKEERNIHTNRHTQHKGTEN